MKVNKYFFRCSAVSVALLLAIGWCNANADVCTAADCSTSNPLSQMTPTDAAVWCPDRTTVPACPGRVTLPWAQFQSYSWTLTTDGWFAKDQIPAGPPPFVPAVYSCTPKTSLSEYRWDYEGTSGVAIWYCDLPTKIAWHHYCGNPINLPKHIIKAGLAAIGLAVRTNQFRACTPEENAIVNRLHANEGVKITVSPSVSGTRPIYARKPDNTRGSVTGKRAKAGDPCGFNRLQNADKTGSMYFAVDGGYTLCKINGVVSK